MGWKDLLQVKGETIVLPWIGGRVLRQAERSWTLDGPLPREHGWYTFGLAGRKARLNGPAESTAGLLRQQVRGYLVGDWIVPDNVRVDPDPARICDYAKPVHLVEPGLDRFARVQVGAFYEDGPLIYGGQEMPLGPEGDVLQAYYNRIPSLDGIKGVAPALDAAFRMEMWRTLEAQKRREEIAKQLREEEERRQLEERREQIRTQLGDAAGRRAMAVVDFGEAARASLAVGGATYLDHRPSTSRGEMVVTFRFMHRQFECTCDARTLRIIDSGICLNDHATGEKGDAYFTLESLPGVIGQADRERKLVVFRHVGDDRDDDDDD